MARMMAPPGMMAPPDFGLMPFLNGQAPDKSVLGELSGKHPVPEIFRKPFDLKEGKI